VLFQTVRVLMKSALMSRGFSSEGVQRAPRSRKGICFPLEKFRWFSPRAFSFVFFWCEQDLVNWFPHGNDFTLIVFPFSVVPFIL